MSFFSLSSHTVIYIGCFILYALFELLIRVVKNKHKKEYRIKKETIHSLEETEQLSLEHFNRLQTLDITRIVAFAGILVVVLSVADIKTFSFLAVTLGAIIISLRDYIISLISYVYVLAHFDIGDDIKVGAMLGEIVRIRPLTTAVAGKDKYGDFDGVLYHIPNSKFITDVVERQEMKNNAHRRINLEAIYSQEIYKDIFSVWINNLKKELDETLPKHSLKEVGNFKSYAGLRYKFRYDYNEDGDIVVTISFIARPKNALSLKETIISYIETTKKEDGGRRIHLK